MHDKTGAALEPSDKVLFLLAGRMLKGVAVEKRGERISIKCDDGKEYGIAPHRILRTGGQD